MCGLLPSFKGRQLLQLSTVLPNTITELHIIVSIYTIFYEKLNISSNIFEVRDKRRNTMLMLRQA